jgi:heme-degrading monooxygenase HmoA
LKKNICALLPAHHKLVRITVMPQYHISVTGLQFSGFTSWAKFIWYAPIAKKAAAKAEGNVHTSTHAAQMPNVKGENRLTMMTLTVWESREATMKYTASPAHKAASSALKQHADYMRFYHGEGDTIPTWDEAKKLWREQGRDYGASQ